MSSYTKLLLCTNCGEETEHETGNGTMSPKTWYCAICGDPNTEE